MVYIHIYIYVYQISPDRMYLSGISPQVRRCSLRMGQAAAVQVLRLAAPAARRCREAGTASAVSLRASFSELVPRPGG